MALSARELAHPGTKPENNGRGLVILSALLLTGTVFALLITGSRIGVFAVAGLVVIALLAWAVRQTLIDPLWLMCALALEETIPYLNLLPFDPSSRWWIRYPLLLAFCAPAIPAIIRSGLLTRGYFRAYMVYFAWAAISVTYSLYPTVSGGRLLPVIILFGVLSLVASRIRDGADVQKMLGCLLIGCGVLVFLNAIAWLLPANIFIAGDTPTQGIYNWMTDEVGILRFTGFFATPNEMGALMLSTVSVGLLHWQSTTGRRRYALAATMLMSILLALGADSRSNFITLAIGIAAYSIWKYRARAVIACLAVVLAGVVLYSTLSKSSAVYFNRDLTTLTGRTIAWNFELHKLAARPFTGYGYDVEGAIFEDRTFSEWTRFWLGGPETSLHNSFLTVAIGLGIPALIFWVYILLAPWIALFRQKVDPWNLKPVFFLVVLPSVLIGFDESGLAEPRYIHGLLVFVCWMIAERQRQMLQAASAQHRHAVRTEDGIDFRRLFAGALGLITAMAVAGLLTARTASAADYYVDSVAGNDSNAGTAITKPWGTLGRVDRFAFEPGDVVHLKRESIFREVLSPRGAGGANFRGVAFVAYGSGDPPTITGSTLISDWTAAGDGIYRASTPSRIYNVFVDDGPGWGLDHACCMPGGYCRPTPRNAYQRGQTCALGPMRPGSWYTPRSEEGAGVLYVWLPGSENPAGHRIEAVVRPIGFHGWARGHQLDGITLDGLRFVNAGLRGISLESEDNAGCCGTPGAGDGTGIRGLVIKNCVIERTGTGRIDDGSYGNAITIINASAPLLENNVISYAGNHGNAINVQNASGARILGNRVDHWNHNGIDIKGSRDVLVANNIASDQRDTGAGYYTEFSSDVTFSNDRAIHVSNGFQISANSTANIINSQIADAGTCVYFGPRAFGATIRGNTGRGCSSGLEGDALTQVVQHDNSW